MHCLFRISERYINHSLRISCAVGDAGERGGGCGEREPAHVLLLFFEFRPENPRRAKCQILSNQRTLEMKVKVVNKLTWKKCLPALQKKCVVKGENVNQYCQCCKLSLRVRNGDTWKSLSSENVFQACRKRGAEGEILSNMLERVGISCEKNHYLLERFCKACVGKLRRTYEGFNFFASNINAPGLEFGLEEEEDEAAALFRTKRMTPSSFLTPERSPHRKKMQRTADGNTTALGRKDGKRKNDAKSDDRSNSDALLNIDDILCETRSTRVKVLILWPNGKTVVQVPSLEEVDSILL